MNTWLYVEHCPSAEDKVGQDEGRMVLAFVRSFQMCTGKLQNAYASSREAHARLSIVSRSVKYS